ncbi:MAG: hypothetical protein JSS09_07195 [Verrucomicrobia bacterium]|nr:hypothetical protein [Verrucomicrobiota bacterium]
MKIAMGLLFCSGMVMADSFKQGEPLSKEQYPAGYNAPASVSLQGKGCRPDISFDASFLYYYAGEDGLDLANSAAVITEGGSAGVVVATSNSTSLLQDFAYKPGFKVGLGLGFNEWNSHAEYTWVRQTTSTSKKAIDPSSSEGDGVWLLNNWFQQITSVGQTISATNVSSKWHLAIDLADLTMSRPFYEGRYLSVDPFFGIRGAWIRQKLNLAIHVPTSIVSDVDMSQVHSYNSSHSWGVGPRTGFDMSWLLGKGFKVEAEAAFSLLFTQYTKIKHAEQVASEAASPDILRAKLSYVNCVRPELDLGLGIGWGSYLAEQKYYIDFSAKYEFLLFWQQNMMRKLADQTVSGTGAAAGDLYLQGLDIRASFHF